MKTFSIVYLESEKKLLWLFIIMHNGVEKISRFSKGIYVCISKVI